MTTQTPKSRTGSGANDSSAITSTSYANTRPAKTPITLAANTAMTRARGPTVIDYRVNGPEASGVFFDPNGDEDDALRSLRAKYGNRLVWFCIRNKGSTDE